MEKKSMEQVVEELEDEIKVILAIKGKNRVDIYDDKSDEKTYQLYEYNDISMYYSPDKEYLEIIGLPFVWFKELVKKYGK